MHRVGCILFVLPSLCLGCATNLQLAKARCEQLAVAAHDPTQQSHCVKHEVARIEALDRYVERDLDERLRNEHWRSDQMLPYR